MQRTFGTDRHLFALSLANDLRAAAQVPRPPAAVAEPEKPSSALLEHDFGEIEARAFGAASWD